MSMRSKLSCDCVDSDSPCTSNWNTSALPYVRDGTYLRFCIDRNQKKSSYGKTKKFFGHLIGIFCQWFICYIVCLHIHNYAMTSPKSRRKSWLSPLKYDKRVLLRLYATYVYIYILSPSTVKNVLLYRALKIRVDFKNVNSRIGVLYHTIHNAGAAGVFRVCIWHIYLNRNSFVSMGLFWK